MVSCGGFPEEGEDQAMMPYYARLTHQSPQPFMCHPIMSYNVSAFHRLGVIHPLLSSLTSQLNAATVDIILVYCSNEARFRVRAPMCGTMSGN